MRKYESYKPIEELWLTQIPASWEDIKIKFLFSERSEKGYPDEPLLVASQNMGVVPKGVCPLPAKIDRKKVKKTE